jgi:hypothetical protein
MKDIRELTDEELMNHAVIFALQKAPRQEDGLTTKGEDFQRTKATFLVCLKWMRENYEDKCTVKVGCFEG